MWRNSVPTALLAIFPVGAASARRFFIGLTIVERYKEDSNKMFTTILFDLYVIGLDRILMGEGVYA